MRKRLGRLQNRFTVFLHDLVMIPAAWVGAYWLRFNLDGIPAEYWRQALSMLPVVLLVQGAMFWYFGLYRGVWRFASIPDLARILKAVLAGVAVAAGAIFFLTRLQGVPRSVFVLDGILLLMLIGGPRFVYHPQVVASGVLQITAPSCSRRKTHPRDTRTISGKASSSKFPTAV